MNKSNEMFQFKTRNKTYNTSTENLVGNNSSKLK